jgi:tetraacyldisaccharide 4'-kinase
MAIVTFSFIEPLIGRLHYKTRWPGFLKAGLGVFCWPYLTVVLLKAWAYRTGLIQPYRAPVPVLSVGNLTTGGTGKTPVTLALMETLQNKNKQVCVLSRGYGARRPQAYAKATHPDFGDEAASLQQAVPNATVIVGANRKANAQRATNDFKPDYLLLDDGFQTLPLARDWNLVLVDAERLFGNELTLPLGPLREPLSALRRATGIGLTRLSSHPQTAFQQQQVLKHKLSQWGFPHLPIWPIGFETSVTPAFTDTFNKKQATIGTVKEWLAISGLANPKAFETTLQEALGLNLSRSLEGKSAHWAMGDHFVYTPFFVEEIVQGYNQLEAQQSQKNRLAFITTEKDAVKLRSLWPQPLQSKLWVVHLKACLPEALLNTLP